MKPYLIYKAQECLTVRDGTQTRKVIDIENLFNQHDPEMVTQILNRLYLQYQMKLTCLVLIDKTNPEIEVLLSRLFRIFLTIRVIERDNMEGLAA